MYFVQYDIKIHDYVCEHIILYVHLYSIDLFLLFLKTFKHDIIMTFSTFFLFFCYLRIETVFRNSYSLCMNKVQLPVTPLVKVKPLDLGTFTKEMSFLRKYPLSRKNIRKNFTCRGPLGVTIKIERL